MIQPILNTKLFQRKFAKQELFITEMSVLPTAEVLDRAYMYVCWEGIRRAIEFLDGFRNCWNPLHQWLISSCRMGREYNQYMKNIWNAVEA